jgi:hypothetical protein
MDEAKRLWVLGIGFAVDPDPILLSKAYRSPVMAPISSVLDDFASKFALRKPEILAYLKNIGHPFTAEYAAQQKPAIALGTVLKNTVLVGVGLYCALRGEWILVALALLCLIPSIGYGLILAIALALSLIIRGDYIPGSILAALILYNIVGWAWVRHRFEKTWRQG